MMISTLEAMKKANKEGQSKAEADRLISLYLDIPIDQVRSTPREEYDQLYTRMMEKMNIEPESFGLKESKDIGPFRSDEQPMIDEEPKPMKNEPPTNIDKSKIGGMDYYLAVEPIQKQIQDLQIKFKHQPLSDGERNILQMFLAKSFELNDTGSFKEEPQPMKNEQTQNIKIKPEQFDLKDTGSFNDKTQNKIKEPQIKKKHKPLSDEQRNFIRNRLWNQYYWPVIHASYDTVQWMGDKELIDNYNRIFDADL